MHPLRLVRLDLTEQGDSKNPNVSNVGDTISEITLKEENWWDASSVVSRAILRETAPNLFRSRISTTYPQPVRGDHS